MLEPAKPHQVMSSLINLRLHFPAACMTKEEVEILMRDYLADMVAYPIDIIEQAALKETSLFHLANLVGIENPKSLVDTFINYENEVKDRE